ncbi:MAG: hypothetical protein LCH37_02105 [Bacteroidetes bacterium]|nr:hypothetical protein [Bacteroidota bacterium]
MQISCIKQLAENYTIEQLREAEECLMEEKTLPFPVSGESDCEQMTHILAAIEILELKASSGQELRMCIREFSQRVRTSISS